MTYSTLQFPHYSAAERRVDAWVHGAGLGLALAATPVLLWIAARSSAPQALLATTIYAASLLGMLGASAAYNMTRPSALKRVLRRLDHSAIFVKIAGAYTPLCLLVIGGGHGWTLLAAVWALGGVGVLLKMSASDRVERFSVPAYVALGWAIVFCAQAVLAAAPPVSLALFVAGGVAYSLGVPFHVARTLPYQNAIWHVFVVVGSALIFAANATILL
ncbi:MAG: hemolysin III family protein [Pseudomonadota bacterium]